MPSKGYRYFISQKATFNLEKYEYAVFLSHTKNASAVVRALIHEWLKERRLLFLAKKLEIQEMAGIRGGESQ